MWKSAFFVRTFLISILSWNWSFNSFVRFCHDDVTVVLFVEITERTDEENKEAAHSITERRRPYVILRTGRKFLSSGLLLPYFTLWSNRSTRKNAIYTVALTTCGNIAPLNKNGRDRIQFPCQSSNMTKKHQRFFWSRRWSRSKHNHNVRYAYMG